MLGRGSLFFYVAVFLSDVQSHRQPLSDSVFKPSKAFSSPILCLKGHKKIDVWQEATAIILFYVLSQLNVLKLL